MGYCQKCRKVVTTNAKFCSSCGSPLLDEPPAAPGSYPAGTPVCPSCRTPGSSGSKFCGTCGTALVVYAPPPPPPPTRFCTGCGVPLAPNTRFCGSCGSPANPDTPGVSPGVPGIVAGVPYVPPPPPPVYQAPPPTAATPVQAPAGGETVLGVIANAYTVKMFGLANTEYTLVLTTRRMILAQLTGELLNAAAAETNQRARAEGKGYFDIVKEQLKSHFNFSQRYLSMTPDAILSQTAGNRAIENGTISAIHLKVRDMINRGIPEGSFRLVIESGAGKEELTIPEDEGYTNLLKQVYGERVHMPFGYSKYGRFLPVPD